MAFKLRQLSRALRAKWRRGSHHLPTRPPPAGLGRKRTMIDPDLDDVITKGAKTDTYPAPGSARPHTPTAASGIGSYTYDANGNRKTDPTYSYTYTVENLLAVLKQGATTILQNTFDGDGQRLVRVVGSTTAHCVGATYEVNPSTWVATLYCLCNGRPVAMKQGSTITYLHHDQLGSMVSATSSAGLEVAAARYWPFGSRRTSTGTLPTDRLFAGQTRDLGLDALYWSTYRYLDTTIGKFHTPDTIVPDPGNPQALNRYSYVLNQLLKFTDPTGHMVSMGDTGGGDVTSIYDPSTLTTTDASGPTSAVGTAADNVGDPSAPAGNSGGSQTSLASVVGPSQPSALEGPSVTASAGAATTPTTNGSGDTLVDVGVARIAAVGNPDTPLSSGLSTLSQSLDIVDLSLTGGLAVITGVAALASNPAAALVGEAF
jgi:RHS repeat-associated protein